MRPLAYEWHMPAVVYEWDLDSDCFRLVRVFDVSVSEPLPRTLTVKCMREHHKTNDQLQSVMLQLPFIVLRERNRVTVCSAGGRQQVTPAFNSGPGSDAFHMDEGYMMLVYASTVASYECNSSSGVHVYVASCTLHCDALRLPVRLQRHEVPHYLSVRRMSITKQLQDRRLVVRKGQLVGSYICSTMEMLKSTRRRTYELK